MPRKPPRLGRERKMVECFVAACSGSARLAGEVGHAVVLCNVALDATQAVADLNRKRYGEATLWPGSFQPLEPQKGWDDWMLFDVDLGAGDRHTEGYGVKVERGVIRFPLPDRTHVAEVREHLAGALRHLRFHDVVRQPSWLEHRSETEPLGGILVHPRYVVPEGSSFQGAALVEDIYVLDPAEQATMLLWRIIGAFVAAGEERPR